MKKLGEYKNGNYITKIYDDGTRIRQTECDEFIPEFPESIDLNISDLCENECPFCYANHTKNGKQADLTQDYLFTMKPYTEIAINLNTKFCLHENFLQFLEKQKENNVIVNGTVNVRDFKENYVFLRHLSRENLLHGIGVSVGNDHVEKEDIMMLNSLPNTVFHIVNRVVDLNTLTHLMSEPNLKVLILGYKERGRGELLNPMRLGGVPLNSYIEALHDTFRVVSYDNLALEQLSPQQYLSSREFEVCYQGDEGKFSFYIDAVKNRIAVSSNTDKTFVLDPEMTIQAMFRSIQVSFRW